MHFFHANPWDASSLTAHGPQPSSPWYKELAETSDPKAREAIRSALKATEAFDQIPAIGWG
ncbi:MAG: hypothetical protein FWG30_07185 [Eubacteriaceae bacterium]|nr:hypothetical protein [Eubacteriaceae bacterium]